MRRASFSELLEASAARHAHLCPRQVLGVRIALAGASCLGLEVPQTDKRLLVILETDGCFADGIEVATGCSIGHRTLRVEDYGKIAATFVDIKSEQAIRVAPRSDVRLQASAHVPDESRHYFAQLAAYQSMPDSELLSMAPVRLRIPAGQILSRPGVRVSCEICGEEIINERELAANGHILCRACALGGYYTVVPVPLPLSAYSASGCLRHQ